MIRRSAASICIFALIFNIAFLNAQEEDTDVDRPAEVEQVEENIEDISIQEEVDSLNTPVAEESLSVQVHKEVEPDTSSSAKEEVLPRKTFKGTGADVILAVGSILTWLFFMWLAANQRE